jgi:hypothetical protein
LLVAGCGDDNGTATNIGPAATTSSTSSAAAASGCKVEGGTTTTPDQQVVVMLGEWVVKPSVERVEAGTISLIADNAGQETHELVVVKGESAERLPTGPDGAMDEDKLPPGAFIGEIEEFPAGQVCKGAFSLAPGSYLLVCNIVETEPNGEKESHFKEGMHAPFTVT